MDVDESVQFDRRCLNRHHDGKLSEVEATISIDFVRRSLAARRRTTKLLTFDDEDEEEDSLNEALIGPPQSRLLNNSFSVDNVPDEPAQTPTQLVDLYQKTVELATQGKINVKNAFSIPLVERLPQVLNVIALEDKENHNLGPNFVKAGSVIDTRFV